jgi:anti-anti-sigma factor
MLIELVQHEDVWVLRLKGRLVLSSDLERLHVQVDEIRRRDCRKVLADFREVPHIESTTIGFLVSIYTSVTRKGGGRFVLAGPSPRVRQVLDLMRLSTVIPLAPDFESGLALLRAEGAAASA